MHRTLLVCALLAGASWACKKEQAPPPSQGAAPPAGADSAAAPGAPATGPSTQRPAPPPPTAVVRDEPYVSEDTGTVAPGMSEREVYALWGPPVAVRRAGDMTYLYFKNGCEYSCGTMDVVFLQSGAVVDAIVRWPGHGYSGMSSSPPGTKPAPTRGGDTLVMPTTPEPRANDA